MKTTITSLLVILTGIALATGSAQAAALMSDNFDSYNLTDLVGQDSWAAHSGAGNKPVQVVVAPLGLTGKVALLQQSGGSGEDVNKTTGYTMGTGDTWYASFQVVVTGSDKVATTDYFAHFLQTSNFGGKAFVTQAPDSKDFTFGFSASSGGATTSGVWSTGFDFNSVHTVVVSYDYNTGTGSMWVDPIYSLGPGGNASIYDGNGAHPLYAMTAFAFRQSSLTTCNQYVDNLMVGSSWNDVVVPEPATLGLLALGGLAVMARRKKN